MRKHPDEAPTVVVDMPFSMIILDTRECARATNVLSDAAQRLCRCTSADTLVPLLTWQWCKRRNTINSLA